MAQVLPELGGWLVRYQRPLSGHGIVDALYHDDAVIARYPREMWAGSPAKLMRAVTPEEFAGFADAARRYSDLADEYNAGQ